MSLSLSFVHGIRWACVMCILQLVYLTNSFLKITKEEKAWAYRLCERYWRSKCQLTKQGESCRRTRTKPEEPPPPPTHPSTAKQAPQNCIHQQNLRRMRFLDRPKTAGPSLARAPALYQSVPAGIFRIHSNLTKVLLSFDTDQKSIIKRWMVDFWSVKHKIFTLW